MKSPVLPGLACAGCVLALCGAARADCTMDAECKGDRLCVSGACVDPNAPPEVYAPPPAPGVPAGPAPGTVPVTFRGAEGYTVRSVLPSGQVVECPAPCTLYLFPGLADVEVVGEFKEVIQIPNHPCSAEISFKRKGLMITGIVVAAFGAGAIGLGAMLKADYDECMAEDNHSSSICSNRKGTSTGFFITGAVLAAAGIGMFVPGLLSKTEIVVGAPAAQQSLWKRLDFGFAPRREGGGFLSARYAF